MDVACTASPTGDWYCRNCGYLSGSRVTSSETCDTCHQPVEFHDLTERSALASEQARTISLTAALTKARNFIAELQHEADPEAADLLAVIDRALAGEPI